MLQYPVLVGAALNAVGSVLYIRDTWRGTSQPNRVTFLMWAVSPLTATAAALTKGVRWAVVPVFMAGFGPLSILLVSLANRKAYWKLGKLDYTCGAFSALALILWGITRQPAVAIAFAIVSDTLATFPTLIKSWNHPETETGIAYVFSFISAATSFAAVRNWTFAECAFPIYLVIINIALSVAVYTRLDRDTDCPDYAS